MFFYFVLSYINKWTVVLTFSLFLLHWWRRPSGRFPPGPRGVPFFGVLPFLGQHPQKVLRRWALTYGPIMSVRMANRDVVFLNNCDVINEALVKQSRHFSGRPNIAIYNQVVGYNGMVFVDYDEKQKFSKKFAIQAFRRLGLGQEKMEDLIIQEAEHFIRYLSTKENQPLDFEVELIGALCNIMLQLVLGRRLKYDDLTLKKIIKHGISKPGDANRKMTLMYFHKVARHIPPFRGTNQRFIEGEVAAADVFRRFIEEHKKNFNPDSVKDYIDMYLHERECGTGKNKQFLTDRQLEGCVRDLVMAGSNDLRILLRWDILCLLNFPEYQEKVVQEIDLIIGSSFPRMSHLKQMPFTYSFLQEVWRYCPAVPNGVLHHTSSDVEINGFHLPRGTHVLPNIYSAHYDPEVWKNPEIFDPMRHIDENRSFIRSHKIIPCSVGPRYCFGRDMAHVEEFIILASLLQVYRILPATSSLPDVSEGVTTLVYSPHEYKAILKRREKTKLFPDDDC